LLGRRIRQNRRTPHSHDVVGAGPVGALCAYSRARRGISVALLERKGAHDIAVLMNDTAHPYRLQCGHFERSEWLQGRLARCPHRELPVSHLNASGRE
jgi:choline dehydrogenase-like flavoprotein